MLADQRELGFGGGLGEEVVDARFLGDRGRGQAVIAGHHDRADPHRTEVIEPLAHALLDRVLEVDHAEDLAVARDGQRCSALTSDSIEVDL